MKALVSSFCLFGLHFTLLIISLHGLKNKIDHILKYTGVFGGVQGLVLLMGVVRNKLTTKLLGVVGYGLLGEYTTIVDGIHSSTNCGIGFASVRRASELFESGDKAAIANFVAVVRTWCLWIGIAGAVACIAFSPLLCRIYFEPTWENIAKVACLAPMLLCMAVTIGEASILKGIRRLKRVASITALGAVATLVLTVPIYWLWGIAGIIIAMNVATAAAAAIHLCFTVPLFPWRVSLFSANIMREGWTMVRIGIPFVMAAVAGSIMAIIITAILKRGGGDEVVGLYRQGYILMGTYAGLVFAAFEADYFPRLSSINTDIAQCNELINKQILVSVLLVAPMLIAMIVLMPALIRLLSTDKFLPATAMAVCAVFYPFLRALSMPMSYMALARGDSHIFLLAELVYDVASILLIWVSFSHWGLTGAGIGLSLSAAFDVVLIALAYGYLYKVRLTRSTLRLALAQGLTLGAAMLVCLFTGEVAKYILGTLLLTISAYFSYRVLKRESTVIDRIRRKFHLNKT